MMVLSTTFIVYFYTMMVLSTTFIVYFNTMMVLSTTFIVHFYTMMVLSATFIVYFYTMMVLSATFLVHSAKWAKKSLQTQTLSMKLHRKLAFFIGLLIYLKHDKQSNRQLVV